MDRLTNVYLIQNITALLKIPQHIMEIGIQMFEGLHYYRRLSFLLYAWIAIRDLTCYHKAK